MPSLELCIGEIRRQFPALSRMVNDQPAIYFDGPGGTQVPQRVIDAISDYLSNRNANHGGPFLTSRENDAMLDEAQQAMADFLGASNPDCVTFGPNMTTLTFTLSRALARTWQPGDEVLVTRLDHDANVTPWVLAAQDAGATVKYVDFHHHDCTLDLDDLRSKLTQRTRLVAVGCGSNAVGTINPVQKICAWAHAVGALTFLDAVHFAPHAPIDVEQLGCDFLACSPYKFFGPHTGLLWGKQELLEQLVAYKLRAATNELPDKWTLGTLNHECIAGAIAAVDYLADLGRSLVENQSLSRRQGLQEAYAAIGAYERKLLAKLLAGLQQSEEIKVWGITDPARFDYRLPTVSITHDRISSSELAQRLGDAGIFVWQGNFYALAVTESLGLEPEGMVRIGLVHYNTETEVERLLNTLSQL
jgi:cysteine desulfurase family protein (TIGR01976 family)